MSETQPRLFLATAYKHHRGPVSGEVGVHYRRDNEAMIEGLAANGFSVYNSLHEFEYDLSGDNTGIDLRDDSEIRSCDAYLEIMDALGSRGNGINLGAALVLGKTVILSHTSYAPLEGREKAMVANGRAHELETTTPLNYSAIHEIIAAHH